MSLYGMITILLQLLLLLNRLLFTGEDSPYEHDSSKSDAQALPKPLYVLSGQCYVTEEHEEKIVALVQATQPEMPLLVAMMTKPNMKPYPDLVH